MENSKMFCIINVADIDMINFTEVIETDPASLRMSVDGKKTFVKYRGDQPDCLFAIAGNEVGLHEYTYEEFLKILEGPEWNHQWNSHD